MHIPLMTWVTLGVLIFLAGYVLACGQVARRRKCSTLQIVRETLTIQGGGGKAEE